MKTYNLATIYFWVVDSNPRKTKSVEDIVVIALGVVSIVVDVVGAKEVQRLSVRESLSSVNEV